MNIREILRDVVVGTDPENNLFRESTCFFFLFHCTSLFPLFRIEYNPFDSTN